MANFTKAAKKAAKNAWVISTYINPAIMIICSLEGANVLSVCRGQNIPDSGYRLKNKYVKRNSLSSSRKPLTGKNI
jgi:hypothetical protein